MAAQGQAIGGPPQGHRHGGLAAGVEQGGEGGIAVEGGDGLGQRAFLVPAVQLAQAWRFAGQGRGEDHIVVGEKARQGPTQGMQALHRGGIAMGRDVAPLAQDHPRAGIQLLVADRGAAQGAKDLQVVAGAGADDVEDLVEKAWQIHRQGRRLDVVAEAFAQPGGVARRGQGVGSAGPGRQMLDQGDAQGARIALQQAGEGDVVGRCGIGRAKIGTGGGIQQQGVVAYRKAHGMGCAHTGPAFTDHGPGRHPATAGLEAEDPAAGGRHSQGATAVVAMGEGHHPRGDQGCRAATRSPGTVGAIPGIGGGAEAAGLGAVGGAEFR